MDYVLKKFTPKFLAKQHGQTVQTQITLLLKYKGQGNVGFLRNYGPTKTVAEFHSYNVFIFAKVN